ncbi:MAG: hypothetical protein H0W74_13610 [Sphingosinicella sp.]|nr:hypothetical protein [Sphingosinicella sp.]
MPLLLIRYWKAGLAALLLLAFGLQTLRLAACERHSGKVEAQLARANALIEVQNEQVAAMEADGRRLTAKVEKARAAGEKGIEAARAQAARVRVTPANGCATPAAIMEAYR